MEDYNIEEIRETLSKLVIAVERQKIRSLMPYDWNRYGNPELVILCHLLKVRIGQGDIMKKDKRGYWR